MPSRETLFFKFSSQLTLLIDSGLLEVKELPSTPFYVCPLCLDIFSEEALKQDFDNPLTLEDVPLKSLGGKPKVLTCKNCNNSCGSILDVSLARSMKNMDASSFIPGAEIWANFKQ